MHILFNSSFFHEVVEGMGCLEEYKPGLAMVVLQFLYAALSLYARAALLQSMSPRIFLVYRQTIATLVMAPTAYLSNRRSANKVSLKMRSFWMIFFATLIGVTINQHFYFQGLYLVSTSIASASGNLIPAITFLMAASIGLEKVDIRSLSSIAKVIGTIICVVGAVSMTLFRGHKLLNEGTGWENWIVGCLFLLGSTCCWSLWLILQVPMCKSYPDPIAISAWMCFLAMLQTGVVALFLEPDPKAWILSSPDQILCCIYAGIVGSGISFYVQAWCISQRGPLFSAMFNPLGTVIVTILAVLLLHEELYLGSLIGATAVVGGLYAVLWGKVEERKIKTEADIVDGPMKITVSIDEGKQSCRSDLKEHLLV
ncbi:WAT1-related protein [Acorus calamus]|uniref:WAT1-related protein n=1 Tax=Acorus calamus TaxID=4465 RepID=A0AAV9EWJ8_ACOCL|nr:WAT1-related protein [Acorus calamus]